MGPTAAMFSFNRVRAISRDLYACGQIDNSFAMPRKWVVSRANSHGQTHSRHHNLGNIAVECRRSLAHCSPAAV